MSVECLHCEQTRAEIKANDTICGIEGGYEYRELEAEWPRHRWRDWTDADLKRAGVRPEFFDQYRREPVSSLQYIACDHHERGHTYPAEDVHFEKWLMHEKDVCMACGKRKGRSDDY